LPSKTPRALRFPVLFANLYFLACRGLRRARRAAATHAAGSQAIADLTAKQAGDGVLLTFTMPGKSTLGERLQQVPTFEVLRGTVQPDGTPDPKSFRVVDTVPGALVARYSQRGQVQFIDPVSPTDPQLRSGQPFVYRVRTLFSPKRPSLDSKEMTLRLYPVAERISSLDASLTEQGINLKWTAPTRTSAGEPFSAVQEYHVYRGELDPATAGVAASDPLQAKWKSPLLQLGTTTTNDYRDSGFDYGKTYAYLVRSVIASPAGVLESSDSPLAIVTPKDTFPPAAPQGIVAAVQPGTTRAPWRWNSPGPSTWNPTLQDTGFIAASRKAREALRSPRNSCRRPRIVITLCSPASVIGTT